MNPITFTLDKTLLSQYQAEISSEIISSIAEILKTLISFQFHTPVEFVDVLERKDAYIFSPFASFATAIFSNSQPDIEIKNLIGYTLLSDSLLTRYILEKWGKEDSYVLTDLGIKYVSNLALIPLPSLNPYSEEIIGRTDNYLSTLIKEGYFGYPFGVHDLEDMELIRELCLLSNIQIIDSTDLSTWILKTDVDFKTSPEEWIRYNLQRIRLGSFPKYSISLNFSYFNDYIRLYGSVFRDVILKYASYLSFVKLSDEFPLIRPYISEISIGENFLINVSLPTYSLVLKFEEYLIFELENGISHLDNGIKDGAWNIESCKDLEEGIYKRWSIQQIDNDSYPMVFQDSTNTEILIHRSPLAISYPSLFVFDKEEAKESLYKSMKDFYSRICHDNLEPISLEQIDEMNLGDLLNLIPVEEKGVTYCFSKETLDRLVKKENPLTRSPFSEKVLKMEEYLEDGLRGMFNVGVLYGLYEEVPQKVNVSIDIGIPRITRIRTTSLERELTGNLFSIEILFADGTVSPLFEVSLPTVGLESIDALKEYVNRLWYEGYFLSDWGSAVVSFSDLSSFPVLVTSSIFRNAGSSIFDGNLAMEKMSKMVKAD